MIQVISTLEEKIESRRARIAVVGLGSVGLPLARRFIEAGFHVLGFDRDREKIARIAGRENTLAHLEIGFVSGMLASGRFEATASAERLSEADVALIAVPTPLSPRREPDLECVITASNMLALHLRRGALVVLESTSYPGTTRKVVGDAFRARGWRPGEDGWLAYSPEREDPGRKLEPGAAVAKLIGGTCERSSELALCLYSAAFERVERTSSAEVAEAAKLLENTFRAVNIALVNELKVVLDALSIDVWEVIDAAATKPFGFMKFTPGPGLGGHCIPIDPHYLEYVAREAGASSRFIELAAEINRSMPRRVVERTRAALSERGGCKHEQASVNAVSANASRLTVSAVAARESALGASPLVVGERTSMLNAQDDGFGTRGTALSRARILLLGVAYKPEVDIVTESPALELLELFRAEGADVHYSDPFVPVIACPSWRAALSSVAVRVGPETHTAVPFVDPGFDREDGSFAESALVSVDHSPTPLDSIAPAPTAHASSTLASSTLASSTLASTTLASTALASTALASTMLASAALASTTLDLSTLALAAVRSAALASSTLASTALTRESIAGFDAVVVVTDHAAFDWDLVAKHAHLVIDTRNALASRMGGSSRYVKA